MTVNVVRRRPRRRAAGSDADTRSPVGENEQTIFACPACARPLALGARRCPGCKTRLVMGTQLMKASIFVSAGVLMGVLLGGGGVAAAVALGGSPTRSAGGAAVVPGAPARESPRTTEPPPSASPTSRATPSSTDVPALSRSALRQSIVLNARLVASAVALDDLLKTRRFDAFEASQILRAMSADAVVGHALTAHLASWPAGKQIATDLTAFYLSVQTTAAEGLAASIRNEAAYRTAATQMVRLLEKVDAVDAELRALAVAAGIELPVATPAP